MNCCPTFSSRACIRSVIRADDGTTGTGLTSSLCSSKRKLIDGRSVLRVPLVPGALRPAASPEGAPAPRLQAVLRTRFLAPRAARRGRPPGDPRAPAGPPCGRVPSRPGGVGHSVGPRARGAPLPVLRQGVLAALRAQDPHPHAHGL